MSDLRKRVVLMEDPHNQPEEPLMEFRLTYEGLLLSTQKDALTGQKDARASHKHEIRKVFHEQLKRLWDITPFLDKGRRSGPGLIMNANMAEYDPPIECDRATLAARYALYNHNFIPLVTEELNLICGLDILFLRPDVPGKLLGSGDIDNRLKTLFDALRIPVPQEDYSSRSASEVENPFYCLLEDDKLITKVSVETDQLLQFTSHQRNINETRLIITVRIRPYDVHVSNMQFG